MEQPLIHVGIVHAIEVHFTLDGNYTLDGVDVNGEQVATYQPNGTVLWHGTAFRELKFMATKPDDKFLLHDVVIGINFHWERKETQVFQGSLKLMIEDSKVVAVNILPVEKYLVSVISSEMKATAGLQYLKAHAVISRSWVLAQMEHRRHLPVTDDSATRPAVTNDKNEIVINRWYGRSAHTLFDVCADDHCQRYQGITRASNPTVEQAVKETRGEVLTYGGEICDARFSKSCGGISEAYEYCWDDTPHPYLKPVLCNDDSKAQLPDLRIEANADKWIRQSPVAFCNTKDRKVLAQILNDYDQETTDFYRWKVSLSQEKLQSLIAEKQHVDIGHVLSLIPLERGCSGRITKLKIEGGNKTLIIGKELEIRRTLSDSHLLSSAFVVDKTADGFLLTGAGWGHGVGFCQIGGAVMAEKGYLYDQILFHYFTNAALTKRYS